MGACLNHRITVSHKPPQWLTTILCLLLLTTISELDYTFCKAHFQENKWSNAQLEKMTAKVLLAVCERIPRLQFVFLFLFFKILTPLTFGGKKKMWLKHDRYSHQNKLFESASLIDYSYALHRLLLNKQQNLMASITVGLNCPPGRLSWHYQHNGSWQRLLRIRLAGDKKLRNAYKTIQNPCSFMCGWF